MQQVLLDSELLELPKKVLLLGLVRFFEPSYHLSLAMLHLVPVKCLAYYYLKQVLQVQPVQMQIAQELPQRVLSA